MADQMRRQATLIAALDAEVGRQLLAAQATSGGIATRATILVAAAGLSAGFQAPTAATVSTLLAALAAITGVMLLTLRLADEVPVPEAERTFWKDPPAVARPNLMYWKYDVLQKSEHALKWRRSTLILGFACFALSIVVSALDPILRLMGGGE